MIKIKTRFREMNFKQKTRTTYFNMINMLKIGNINNIM